jgi:hypothetical protein
MKKEDAVENLERAGNTIHDLYARAWGTALYPTQNGWGQSLASIAVIPVLSLASLGHTIGTAVVSQIPPEVFDKLPTGKKPGEP